MLSSTIFPCDHAHQRERMMALQRAADLRSADVTTAHQRITSFIAKQPTYAGVEVVPVLKGPDEQLYVYDRGSLRMTIRPVEP